MWRQMIRNRLHPTAVADSMYTSCAMPRAEERTTRAMEKLALKASAKTMFLSAPPVTDNIPINRRMAGIDCITSMVRTTSPSTQPLQTAAATPIAVAKKAAIIVAPNPTRIETRAPKIARLKISLPNWSVPQMWEDDGLASGVAFRGISSTRYGASRSAPAATTTKRIKTTPLAAPMGWRRAKRRTARKSRRSFGRSPSKGAQRRRVCSGGSHAREPWASRGSMTIYATSTATLTNTTITPISKVIP